jgi:hypothetical protein
MFTDKQYKYIAMYQYTGIRKYDIDTTSLTKQQAL